MEEYEREGMTQTHGPFNWSMIGTYVCKIDGLCRMSGQPPLEPQSSGPGLPTLSSSSYSMPAAIHSLGIPDAEMCTLHQKKRGVRNLRPYPDTEVEYNALAMNATHGPYQHQLRGYWVCKIMCKGKHCGDSVIPHDGSYQSSMHNFSGLSQPMGGDEQEAKRQKTEMDAYAAQYYQYAAYYGQAAAADPAAAAAAMSDPASVAALAQYGYTPETYMQAMQAYAAQGQIGVSADPNAYAAYGYGVTGSEAEYAPGVYPQTGEASTAAMPGAPEADQAGMTTTFDNSAFRETEVAPATEADEPLPPDAEAAQGQPQSEAQPEAQAQDGAVEGEQQAEEAASTNAEAAEAEPLAPGTLAPGTE